MQGATRLRKAMKRARCARVILNETPIEAGPSLTLPVLRREFLVSAGTYDYARELSGIG
jgi:hypothetical protein